MYAFLRTPRWIIAHVVVLAVAVVFVNLGLWQLRRNAAQDAFNASLTERMTAAAAGLDQLGLDPDAFDYRKVRVAGTYDVGREMLLQPRARRGVSGQHLLTPLVMDSGEAVLIDRGWMPLDVGGPPVETALPPTGPVVVEGILRRPQDESGPGLPNPSEGVLTIVYRIDVDRLGRQLPYPLFPGYVLLESQQPPQPTAAPAPPGPPELGGVAHVFNAVQWFSFTVIGVAGYAAIIRATARRSGSTRLPDA